MRVKKEVTNAQLLSIGFKDYDNDEHNPGNVWGDDIFELENTFYYKLAGGRRGQSYYLFIDKYDRHLGVLATEPDGDGASGWLDDKLLELFKLGFIERSGSR